MTAQRLMNYILFVINDAMISAYEQNDNKVHDNLLQASHNPEFATYIFNWIRSNTNYLVETNDTLGNKELYVLTIDGLRLAYAYYYDNDVMRSNGMTSDAYAEQVRLDYEKIIKEREVKNDGIPNTETDG